VKVLKLLLFPFAVLYDAVTSIRNMLYNRGYKPVASFEIPVISIGNLAVGGTGKTPMVEYLVRLFTPQFKVATLSRGYGRKTRGFRLAGPSDNATTIGDEPYQLYRKFDGRITVSVGEERAIAIPYLLNESPDTQIVLLDDAFQHRPVKPAFQLLLTDYSNLFYQDMLLPAGRLRESSRGASRADIIVVTKCPATLKEGEMMNIEGRIRDYADKPIFFSTIRYGTPIAMGHTNPLNQRVVLLSGIANHKPIEEYLRLHYHVIKHFAFPDHHTYTSSDLDNVVDFAAKENAVVFTTEKDAVKLDSEALRKVLQPAPFFYLPIETEFLKNGKEFDEVLLNTVKPA
jgi:tetraacyldisaccharide 4'-kinase